VFIVTGTRGDRPCASRIGTGRSFLMEKMVEVERAAQDEVRQDLRALFQGAIRITLEMVLEEEV
jgi:hypothetical protein